MTIIIKILYHFVLYIIYHASERKWFCGFIEKINVSCEHSYLSRVSHYFPWMFSVILHRLGDLQQLLHVSPICAHIYKMAFHLI
jgi:hypothetical protein